MRKLIVFLSALILSAVAMAQMTTVTGTVVDSDGTTWANGTISVQFVPNPSYPNMSSYRIGGVALATSVTNQGPLTLSSGGLQCAHCLLRSVVFTLVLLLEVALVFLLL
jgi:archaellum component FlaG (FlaF/FlaG flagellin family)